jgi:hypothetical protein
MNKEQKEIESNRAFWHAHIKGRWPGDDCEAIIKSPKYAYLYARYVINGRWPEAEKTISKDPEHASEYARYVINGRWPEAEETIIKDPKGAYLYARFVIKGRWPEAEETIIKDPKSAYSYIEDVIKGQRSVILELEHLDDTHLCKFSTVRLYVSKIDWADQANDFPIPKRLKRALKKACVYPGGLVVTSV